MPITGTAKLLYAALLYRSGVFATGRAFGESTRKSAKFFAKEIKAAKNSVLAALDTLQELQLVECASTSNSALRKPLPVPTSGKFDQGEGAILTGSDGTRGCNFDQVGCNFDRVGCNFDQGEGAILTYKGEPQGEPIGKTNQAEAFACLNASASAGPEAESEYETPAIAEEVYPPANASRIPPAKANAQRAPDLQVVSSALLKVASPKVLAKLPAEAIALLASCASAKVDSPAEASECSLAHVYREFICPFLEETILSWPAFVRDKLKRAQWTKAEALIFRKDFGYDYFFARVPELQELLPETTSAQSAEQVYCCECKNNVAKYKDALNQGICYDPFESKPRYCKSAQFPDGKWDRAIELAKTQLQNLDTFTVHPRIRARVVHEAMLAIAKDQWLDGTPLETVFNEEELQALLLLIEAEKLAIPEELAFEERMEERREIECVG